MTRITTAALLVLALGACAESTEVSTTEQAVMGNHAGAYVPPARSWNGVAYKAPYGKITVVLDVQPQTPTMVHVYFIDRAADFTYDHVVAKSSQLGGVITATVSLNQDLAIVGTATGPHLLAPLAKSLENFRGNCHRLAFENESGVNRSARDLSVRRATGELNRARL